MAREYPIACICGSTKYKEEHMKAAEMLVFRGYIVVGVNAWEASKRLHDPQSYEEKETKAMLDDMHFRKIEMANLVFIVNKHGYMGESTRNEVRYAISLGKKLEWLEKYDLGCIGFK